MLTQVQHKNKLSRKIYFKTMKYMDLNCDNLAHIELNVDGCIFLSLVNRLPLIFHFVTVDLWNGNDGEPIITHGFTLTTKIKASPVLTVIKENAWKASEYKLFYKHTDLLNYYASTMLFDI